MQRTRPNIIITGTPGVGKTSHCEMLAQCTNLTHLAINKVAKERDCLEGYDDHLKTAIVDEDKLLDAIEKELECGGYIIDWHACDLFPESKIDLVAVIRADSTILYDRLKAREYPEAKLQENLDAEIMQVLLDEARDAYAPEIVVELQSDNTEQLEENVERLQQWVHAWEERHSSGP